MRGAAGSPSWEAGRRGSQLPLGLQATFPPLGPAGWAWQGGGHLPGGGKSLCIALPLPHCPSFSNSDVTPPAFPHLRCRLPPPFPSLHLCLSDSLCPSLGPWISRSLWFWVSPPSPVLGYVNVVFPVSSAGLPAWLTFNLIHGGASAEPLIKAGRQLGECQGGLGPTGRPRPGAGALRGEGQGPGCNLRLPRGLSILGPASVVWPVAWTAPGKTRLASAQDLGH